MQRRIDQQAFTVRVETDDERAIHDLSGKERSLKRHYHKVTPRLVGRIANTNGCSAGFPIERGGSTDDEVAVRLPREDVTGIAGFEGDGARLKIHPIHVENISIAQVHRHEGRSRMS